MDELVTRVGDPEGLIFEIAWDEVASKSPATRATRGSLRILLSGFPVWFGETTDVGFEWTWIELLEFLGRSWIFIQLEDSLPFGLPIGKPSRIISDAERYFEFLPTVRGDDAEAEFEAFLEVHDLSRAVQGAVLPALIVVRNGQHDVLSSEASYALVPKGLMLSSLEKFGNVLAARVATLGDLRSVCATKIWAERWDISARERLTISTGLRHEQLDVVEQGRSPEEVWELTGESFESNELIAAARLSGWLEPDELRQIIDIIRNAPYTPSAKADRLSVEAEVLLETLSDALPYEAGYEIGSWLRTRIDVSTDVPLDPEVLLDEWGVPIHWFDLPATGIDAVACWGTRHGPAVFVNRQGRHSQENAGRRSTLAHEIGHLLVDRRGALPLVDVLGGRVSPHVEARARAFAAELLLPRDVAGAAFEGNGVSPEMVVKRLKRRYGVSAEIVAWQARNSSRSLTHASRLYLRTQVSRPWDF